MKPWRILQFWLFLLFCSYLSLTPAPPEALHKVSDKLLHAVGYFSLYLSLSLAYPRPGLATRKLLALLCYSTLIELMQQVIPNRGFSLRDILANAVGLFAGMFLLRALNKLR